MILVAKVIISFLFFHFGWSLYQNYRYKNEVNVPTLAIVIASFVTLLALFS